MGKPERYFRDRRNIVVKEAIFGALTTEEISQKHGIEPELIHRWVWVTLDEAQIKLYQRLY